MITATSRDRAERIAATCAAVLTKRYLVMRSPQRSKFVVLSNQETKREDFAHDYFDWVVVNRFDAEGKEEREIV